MKTTVFGRSEIERVDLSAYGAVISCVGFNTYEGVMLRNVRSVLTLVFDDVLEEGGGRGQRCFSTLMARRVVEFVSKLPSDAKIAIHCDAGISRSAGIARALELAGIAEWDNAGAQIWDVEGKWRSRFAPNSAVVKEILGVTR